MAEALVNGGFVKRWMGFSWIVSNRLLAPLAGQLDCIAMTRKALGLLVTEDLFVRVGGRSFDQLRHPRLHEGHGRRGPRGRRAHRSREDEGHRHGRRADVVSFSLGRG
jgi:hypothetical protein